MIKLVAKVAGTSGTRVSTYIVLLANDAGAEGQQCGCFEVMVTCNHRAQSDKPNILEIVFRKQLFNLV